MSQNQELINKLNAQFDSPIVPTTTKRKVILDTGLEFLPQQSDFIPPKEAQTFVGYEVVANGGNGIPYGARGRIISVAVGNGGTLALVQWKRARNEILFGDFKIVAKEE